MSNSNVLIASEWNALREGSDFDEDGNLFFTGNLVITCFFEKQYPQFFTNGKKKTFVEQKDEKLLKEQTKDENGKMITRYYKIMYEHQFVTKRATRVRSGFDGWSVTMGTYTVCLPRGRCETREEETLGEVPKDAPKGTKPKVKFVQVRRQSNELLEQIFTFK